MANEIAQNFTTGLVLYACRFQLNGHVFVTDASSDIEWSTATDYEVYLTEAGTSGHYVGDFDTSGNLTAGVYRVVVKVRVGAAPADTDPSISQGICYWDGTNIISPYSNSSKLTIITQAIAALAVLVVALGVAVALITAKLPTNYIMGSSDVDNHDTDIDLILADTNEIQTDQKNGGRLDLIWDSIKLVTDRLPMITTTVATIGDANTFTLTAGEDANDVYLGNTISIQDADDLHWESRMIISWTSARVVVVDEILGFTPAVGDVVVIWKSYYPMRAYWEIPRRVPDDPLIIDYRVIPGGGTAGGTRTLDPTGDDP